MKKKNSLISDIPDNPGVYLMKNKNGKIIYVGKASNLKKRVSSYFSRDTSLRPRISRMVSRIERIDYIVTNTEIDALVLEANLIKLHNPEYNVKFRDDKKYPFIKVTLNEKYPRVFLTRIIKKNGSLYLGPFTDVKAVKRTIKTGRKIFKIRSCGKKLPQRECLDYYIGLCSAPCIGKISEADYRKSVDNIIRFINGKRAELEVLLEKQMLDYSKRLQFEKAKEVKDRLFALRKVQNRQRVVLPKKIDIDIIGFAKEKNICCLVVDEVREGKLIYQNRYFLDSYSEMGETMETFITSYYRERNFIPDEIVVDELPNNKEILESWLKEKAKTKVKILKRVKKEKLSLLRMANNNAEIFLKAKLKEKKYSVVSKEIEDLMKILKLKKPPVRMEAFDISNIMGEYAVGSSVLFVNGKPRKSGYLHYKIRTVKGINDVAMMKEVISRRLKRIIEKKDREKPDLLVIDGGEGQLNAAYWTIKNTGLDIPVISLAKRFEQIHLIGHRVVTLPGDAPALKLLKRIRDESHRFAIQYYRKLHEKSLKISLLDGLKNIGPERKKRLLRYFGSLKKIKEADINDIARVKGFGKKTAVIIWKYLNEKT